MLPTGTIHKVLFLLLASLISIGSNFQPVISHAAMMQSPVHELTTDCGGLHSSPSRMDMGANPVTDLFNNYDCCFNTLPSGQTQTIKEIIVQTGNQTEQMERQTLLVSHDSYSDTSLFFRDSSANGGTAPPYQPSLIIGSIIQIK